ncbi:MAG: ABC transporter ATP-binding protein [Acidimicrobiia bacterium]
MTASAPTSQLTRHGDGTLGADALLAIENLKVRFTLPDRTVYAANGVDLAVHSGEVFALVGESGSGKSVSMLSVMGLVPSPPGLVTGSIRFQGRELTELSRSEMNEIRGADIGMIFQDPMSSLNPVHPVGRQIAEALRLHRKVSRAEANQRAVDLLDRVGIPNAASRVKDYPHEFSGGMRQRVMIAIALACDPKLLIADEPTTALDVTVQRQIVALVKELQSDLGMAVVWITHDLGVVAEIADRVAVMYGGRIMETGESRHVYEQASHPYTSGLLRSIPRIDTPATSLLPEIPGTPAPILAPLDSCPFHSRCPMSEADCPDSLPVLEATGTAKHLSACLHLAELVDASALWPTETADKVVTQPDREDEVVAIEGLKVHFPVHRGGRSRRQRVVRALDGIDLSIHRGMTMGVVGESGCGKSTLGRTLVGLVEPTAGTVTVNGEPLNSKSGPHRRTIQMIFQDPFSSMNPGMKVGDIVAEPLRVHHIGTSAERAERVGELLEKVGLERDAVLRHPHEFSGGQRQRIAIARALAASPEVIVCDEPVSALDVSVQAQIVNLLHDTQQELGVSLIFIAHDLAVVRHISHEVAVMYVGQIVERAPRDVIYEDPLHPYTKALLAAVPVPDPREADSITPPLEGDLPDPADPPPGCRFHTRCPVAVDGLCNRDEPELRLITSERWVACHLVEPISTSLADPSLASGGTDETFPMANEMRSQEEEGTHE